MVKYFLTFALVGSCACAWADANVSDSIKSQKLNEVVVVGKRSWVEDGKAIFVPNRREKRIASDPESLIRAMNMPLLKVDGGSVTSLSGEQVAFFINGVKAEETDLKAFWPKEVKRVEYMENPSDPKFRGARYVVNFIMDKYEFGGVTNANAAGYAPGIVSPRVASKLVYKKMTFGALYSGIYRRDHRSSANSKETYKDFYSDGVKYDELLHESNQHSYNRMAYTEATLNARYLSDKFIATHTLNILSRKSPGSGFGATDDWSHNLFDSQSSTSYNKSKFLSPQLSGDYLFGFSKKWGLQAGWSYMFSHGTMSSASQFIPEPEIYNDNRENVNTLGFSLMPSFTASQKLSFQLSLNSSFDWFNTSYYGSANTKMKQSRQEFSSGLSMYWSPLNTLGFSFRPGLSSSMWQIGNISERTVRPTAEASVNASIGSKIFWGANLSVQTRNPSASESNPVMVRNSELMWTVGNPYLKNATTWTLYSGGSYRASKMLSLSYSLFYQRTDNALIQCYSAAPADKGGIITSYENLPHFDELRFNIDLSGNFFNDKLMVYLQPSLYHAKASGQYEQKLTYPYLNAVVNYTIKDFELSVDYRSPGKTINSGNMETVWQDGRWTASVGYGTDHLKLKFGVQDIFNDKTSGWKKFTSQHFDFSSNTLSTGRIFMLSVSYIFGYGKKVDNNIDVGGPQQIKTSVISNSK